MIFLPGIRVFFFAICLCSGALQVSAAQVLVFAAASLTDSLREIAESYRTSASEKIALNLGASSTLARQIEEGAPADIFFSADEAQMDRLEAHGLIVSGTRTNRLSNELVIIVAARGSVAIRAPQDLAGSSIRRIALGDPKAVPIGVYARRFLEGAGLWQAVAPKVVPTENVRAALAAVEAGNADASIVYKTDALISKRVVIAYTVPPDQAPRIRYPVALLKGSAKPAAAAKFVQYLASPTATAVFEKHGFIISP
ncbi:MAG TPA: molybdate ABC transporter substrate-binding protein [Verrucomicrobiae bacterium]|nr:molybdate ABC transporter substrate-binding protein [Verrucomicrobiae bacterium]